MRATRISTIRSLAKREDGKDVIDRKSVSKIEYDLRKNQVLTIDIDISAEAPSQLSKQVHAHIKKARKQLDFIRERDATYDDWAIWKEHKLKKKTLPQIARERLGTSTGNARSNDELRACIVGMRRAVERIDEKIKALPYPPTPSRYDSLLRSPLQ